MREQEALDPAEREFAATLGRLSLTAIRTSPELLWYRAGLDAGRGQLRRWRAATAGIGMLALGGAAMMASERLMTPTQRTVERIVYVPQPGDRPESAAAPPAGHATGTLALAWGGHLQFCDALARDAAGARPPKPPRVDSTASPRPSPILRPRSPVDENLFPEFRTPANKKG